MRHLRLGLTLTLLLVTGLAPVAAQPAPSTLRLVLLSQWVVDQYASRNGSFAPDFLGLLESAVVDRPVFRWQRGAVPRQALTEKPIRVLSGPEAEALGGRGDFRLVGVRPPSGTSAWTSVDLAAVTARPDDVAVLEVGGELNTVSQVLETLAVVVPGRGLERLPLVRRALLSRGGVQVVAQPFGRPATLPRGVAFHGAAGVEFLIVRSPVETIENGGRTATGPADLSSVRDANGEWREGDRVLIRVPAGTLQAGGPPTLLGWKDRIFREGGPDFDSLRGGRTSLPPPIIR
jgi:hypothetical protein